MNVTCKVETITPEKARRWLKKNTDNFRRIDKSRVENYVNEMKSGWDLNGESIVFHENGYLINGQTRLTACVLSEKTFRSVVVRGIECDSRHVDRGKPRSVAQWLAHEGIPNPTLVAAASRYCVGYQKDIWRLNGWGRHCMTDTEVINFAARYHDQLVPVKPRRVIGLSSSVLLAVLFIGNNYSSYTENETAMWFYESLTKGAELSETDAVLHLRNRLANQEKTTNRMSPFMTRMLLTIAWNKTVLGVECKSLKLVLTGPKCSNLPNDILKMDIDEV